LVVGSNPTAPTILYFNVKVYIMKTLPEQGAEVAGLSTDIVADHLQTVGWGTEDYPVELLELNEKDERILQQVDDGMSLMDVSRSDRLSYSVTATRYYTAKGKKDAQEGLTADVTTLSPLAQRVVVLNSLFGARWTRGHSTVRYTTRPQLA
jgi:hypothetical protein